MVNTTHLAVPAGFDTSQLDLHTAYRVPISAGLLYNYFLTEEDEKANISIPSDTEIQYEN